jgi:mRNA-degrading endonuclease YafQ of YafQ-DinJ toxin-antitoxin module
MRERHDCEAILFLNELFTDNKDILYNENLMEEIASSMTLLVDQIPIEDYYKSHVLDFFRSMTYFKDKHIVINQGRILAKLQDSKKHNIFYRFDPENLERDLHRDINSLVK